jgi:hypothetical protein
MQFIRLKRKTGCGGMHFSSWVHARPAGGLLLGLAQQGVAMSRLRALLFCLWFAGSAGATAVPEGVITSPDGRIRVVVKVNGEVTHSVSLDAQEVLRGRGGFVITLDAR